MIDAEDFIAIQQYKKYGRITPCSECKNYNNKNSAKGYGECSVFGRTMKDKEFCCYGKEKEIKDDKTDIV